jgi:hypothetical protein
MNNAVDSDPVSQEKAHICAERGFDISLSFSLALSLSLSLCVCDIEMSDQYGLPDFRQFMAGRTQYFPAAITQPTEPPFFLHRPPVLHCEPPTAEVLPAAGGQLVGFGHDSSTDAAGASQMDSGWMGSYDGGNTRWPRQETLTLLEIRSRLDSKFKETNQKGPLWDEVSRYIYIIFIYTSCFCLGFLFFFEGFV